MDKWEYLTRRVKYESETNRFVVWVTDHPQLGEWLATVGQQGWELVSMVVAQQYGYFELHETERSASIRGEILTKEGWPVTDFYASDVRLTAEWFLLTLKRPVAAAP